MVRIAWPPPLASLPADDLERLTELAASRVLPAGELLVDEGAVVPSLWVLVDGNASVEVGPGTERALVATLRPGALVGEGSYLSGRPSTAAVTAAGECRLLEIPQDRLRAACEERPDFGLRVERVLSRVFAERLSRSVGGGSSVDLPVVSAETLGSLRTLELDPIEEEAVARYSRFGTRDPFLWRWCLRALELTALPCLPDERSRDTRATKFLAAVTLVIVDDVADLGESVGELERVLALIEGSEERTAEPADSSLYEELDWIWSRLEGRWRRLPQHESLAALLGFDWRMVCMANRQARLARDAPALLNPTENLVYAPHGIAMMVFATLDLMASPPSGLADLRATRELVLAGQSLCELANMLATWRREVPDRDFSSRIFTLGLARGAFTSDDLSDLPADEIVARVERAELEQLLLAEWRSHRARAEAAAARIHGFDPSRLLAGYDTVFAMTLAARGSI